MNVPQFGVDNCVSFRRSLIFLLVKLLQRRLGHASCNCSTSPFINLQLNLAVSSHITTIHVAAAAAAAAAVARDIVSTYDNQ